MPPKKQRPRGKGGKGAGGAPAPPQQNPKGGGGKGNPNKGKGKGARGKGAQQGKGGKGAGGAPAPPVQPVVPNQQNPAAVQPAVAQGVAQNPVTVDTRPAININKKFDDTPGSDTMEWFNEYYPQYQFLSGSMRSTHVFLANDRAHAYAVLRRKQLGYVKDIGARPSEAKTGWHCICPRITVDDSHRWTKTTTKGVVTRSCFYRVASPEGEGMTEDDRWRVSGASGVAGVPIAGVPPHGVSICDHYAQDCTCRFAAATLVSVHSLYYIPRDDIVAMLHDRQRIQRIGRGPETAEPPVALYAYVHNFGPHSMKEGTFKGPNGEVEAVWSRDYNDPSGQTKIVMNVPGESKVYRHDALDWLQPNEGDVYSDPTGRKIGWMSQFTTPFGTMYKFVKVEASVESAATSGSAGQVVTDILSALDKARRGESHVSDSIPIGRIIGCHQAYDILYLSEVGAEDKAFPLTVYLGMRRKVVGAKRSTDGFQALLRFGKRALMDTSLPPGLRLEHAIDNLHLFALLATRVGMEEETLNQTRLGLGGVHEREYREHTLALSGERFPSAIERWSFGTIPLSAADLERILQTSRKIQRVTLAAVTSSPAILLMGVVSGAVAVRYSKVDPKVLRHELLMPLVKFRSYVSNFAFPSIWTMLSGAKHVKAAVIEPAVAATCSRERSPGIPLAMRWDTPSYVAPEHTDQRSLPSLAEAIMGRGRDDCWCMWDAIASCSFIGHALSHWRPDGGGSSSSRIVATASATGGETAPRSDRIGLVTMLGRGVSSLEGGLPPQKGVIGGVVRLPVSEAFPEGSRETMTGFDPSLPRDATEYELTHSAPLQVDQSIFSFLNIVVIAPVVEEWLKRVVGRTTGCGPVVSGVVYGAVEGVMKADMYGSLGIAVGWHAFIHGAMAALPYALGVGDRKSVV